VATQLNTEKFKCKEPDDTFLVNICSCRAFLR